MRITSVHPKGHPLLELETVSFSWWILDYQLAETFFDGLQLVEPLHMEGS
jgi:hypothetical protein